MVDIMRTSDFLREDQINVPLEIINTDIRKRPFRNALSISRIGYYPNSKFHDRIQEGNCPDYTLIYCLDGKGYCQTLQGTFTLQANQFILLPPKQLYYYQADSENPWTIYWIQFNGSMMDELKEDFNLYQYEKPANLPFNAQILETWQEIYSSLSDGYTFENIGYANLSLYRLISLFLFPNRAKKTVQDEKEDQFEQSISYMKANVHKRLTADEIAQKFHYSSSHFSVLFKQKTGQSPIDYFINLKIQHACQLLTQSNLIIKEIAQKVGYEDPFYFSRIFKKITGKSPAEYKAAH